MQIRRQERESKDSEAGMTKSDIINWYMEALEDSNEVETEDQVTYHRKVIKSVLTRMVKKVNFYKIIGKYSFRNSRCN